MSSFTRFKPKMPVAQQRHLIDGTKKIPGYTKNIGSTVPQATFSSLYSKVGLIPDGNVFTTWTKRNSVTGTASISAAGYSNLFWYAASGDVATSTNAINFTLRSFGAQSIQDLIYATNIYVAAGRLGNTGSHIYTSTNAVTWTNRNIGVSTSSALQSIIYANNLFVSAGVGGLLVTSTDAITWTSRTSGTASQINSLAYGNALYVYGGAGGVLATSTDAITWTVRTTSGTTLQINALAYGNALYVYGGQGGVLRTSTDAVTWDVRTSGTTSGINDIKYFSEMNLWWYSGDGGVIATSTNATTWSDRTAAINFELNPSQGLGYGINGAISNFNNMILSAGSSGDIYSAVVSTYNLTTSFLLPNTTQLTYSYLNTNITPATYYKKY